jgi:immunomodulating metalloprotease
MSFYRSRPRRPLLATMALALLLSACGGGKSDGSTDSTGPTPPGQSLPADAKAALEAALPEGDVSKLNDSNTRLNSRTC